MFLYIGFVVCFNALIVYGLFQDGMYFWLSLAGLALGNWVGNNLFDVSAC